jgi:hypothetical protein
MLRRVVATQFDRPARSGKTRPLFLTCIDAAGEEVEVVAKLSAGCEQKEVSLAREVIAACLAGDLGLPVAEPLLVKLPPAWVGSVTDTEAGLACEPSGRVRIAPCRQPVFHLEA